VGISDQLFFRGSFFQTADAQQVRQFQQVPQVPQTQLPQRPRQIPATRPTAATPVESATPTAPCDQQFPRADLALPGLRGPIKLDSCYRGREHFVCSVDTIVAESQRLRSEYEKIVQMNYPSLKTIDPVCRLSSEGVATDIQLRALRPTYSWSRISFQDFEQSNRLSSGRPTAQSPLGVRSRNSIWQPWPMALISSGPWWKQSMEI
jgi:hypothetical protein